MTDDRLDERWIKAAHDYHEPPPTPRGRLWARIDAARGRRIVVRRSPFWQRRTFLWPAAAAVALILGFLIGRGSLGPESGPLQVPPQTERPAGSASKVIAGRSTLSAERCTDAEIYRYAATPTLSQAEMLLTQFRAGEPSPGNGDGFPHRAFNLLAETRLLLDSPAATDRQFRRLLIDLELVLAQIVQHGSSGQEAAVDKEWIAEGLRQRSLLPRLRASLPAGTTVAHLSGGSK